MITKMASAKVRFTSAVGGLTYSSQACGRIDSQFAIKMKKNRLIASGTTKGAVRMPMLSSTRVST
jgi:hypothetical protein